MNTNLNIDSGILGQPLQACPQRMSQTQLELTVLGSTVALTGSLVSDLRKKLAPVLRVDKKDSEQGQAHNECLVPLANDIKSARLHLSGINSELSELLDTLEV